MDQNHHIRVNPEVFSTVPSFQHHEKGAALLTSILVLGLLTLLGVTSLRMSSLLEKMTGNERLLAGAEFAAERGISEGLSYLLDGTIAANTIDASTDFVTLDGFEQKYQRIRTSASGYTIQTDLLHHMIPNPEYAPGIGESSHILATNRDNEHYFRVFSTGISGKAKIDLETVIALVYSSYFKTGLAGCYGVKFLSNSRSDSYSSSGKASSRQEGGISTLHHIDNKVGGIATPGIHDGSVHIQGGARIMGPIKSSGSIILGLNTSVLEDVYANNGISIGPQSLVRQDAYSNGDINGTVNGTTHPNQPGKVVELQECDPLGLPGENGIFETTQHKNAQGHLLRSLPTPGRNDNSELSSTASGGYIPGDTYSYTSQHLPPDSIGNPGQVKQYYFKSFNVEAPVGASPVQLEIHGDVSMFIAGDFSLKNAARVKLRENSSLVIYITGKFLMESGTDLHIGDVPSNFQIYSIAENSTNLLTGPDSEKPKVEIRSNSGFSGAIYAPYAHVVMSSDSDLFGAVRGKWVTMEQNAGFHYDEDLGNIGVGRPQGFKKIYWTHR